MTKVAIFDFDGTIVDTITDVALSFNLALKENGFNEHPLEAFDGFVGGNLETVVSRMLPKDSVSDANVDKVKNCYRRIYSTSSKENTRPYRGVMDLLSKLKENGWKLAINSNKGQVLLDGLVEKLFPQGFFDSVVGYIEDKPSKPDPFGVKQICKECGSPLDRAIYVGDGASDVLTAKAAGIPCIFVTWGQGKCDRDLYDRISFVDNVEELDKEVARIGSCMG